MSFILDALRKSDKRRRMNESPELDAAPAAASSLESRSKRARKGLFLSTFFASVVGAIIVAVAVFAFLQRDRIEQRWTAWVGSNDDSSAQLVESEQTEPSRPDPGTQSTPAANTQSSINANPPPAQTEGESALVAYQDRLNTERERLVSDPQAARAEIERLVASQTTDPSGADSENNGQDSRSTSRRTGQRVTRAAPARPHVTAANEEQAEQLRLQLLRAQQQREQAALAAASAANDKPQDGQVIAGGDAAGQAANLNSAGETSSTAAAEQPWSPSAAEYVRAWELPLSIRRDLPALTLNIHVFSEVLDERFVLINGERYVGGDELTEGARLVDIRREGAIVDYRDYRFLLEP